VARVSALGPTSWGQSADQIAILKAMAVGQTGHEILHVVVQLELVGVRTQPQRVDLLLALERVQ
jgi:hypothetical protein